MKRSIQTLVVFSILLGALFAATPAQAERTFVSLKGGFHVTYPDNWRKVDYNEVDMYLMANRAGQAVFDYEAVLSAHDARPFFRGTYVIITFDSLGQLSDTQIDSVLETYASKFGQDVKYFPVADFLTDLKTDEPSYDKDHKLVSIVSDISERQEALKKHLLMLKFFENGIANFYCYAPDSVFETMKTEFNRIALSLSTEDLDAALERQTSVDMAPKGSAEGGGSVATGEEPMDTSIILLIIAIVVVLIAVLVLLKQRKKV